MASDTRARLLETTAHLVHLRGFHGTSLNDILKESGAPRGSLYYHFPGGKEELVLEAMLQGVRQVTELLQELFAEGCDPAEGVRTYVEAAATELRESGYVFGCPVAPVVLDLAGASSVLEEACRQAFEEWHGLLVTGFTSAGIEAERADALAVMTVSALEGGLILARATRNATPLTVIAEELVAMIQAAVPSTSSATAKGIPAGTA